MAIGTLPSSLLHNEAHGSTLIQQPQLPILALLVLRVPIDPPIKQRPVEVPHQAPNIPRRVGLPTWPRLLQIVDVLLQLVVPKLVVPFVEGVNFAGLWDLDVLLGEHELAVHGVQGEGEHAGAESEDEDDGA